MSGGVPLRVLLSSHGASPFGAERVLLSLAEGLARRGHRVTLEFPHEGPALEEARRLENVEVWHSRRARLPRNATELLRYAVGALPSTIRLWRRIRARRYDVVWVNSMFNPFAAMAGRMARLPVIWHVHERNLRGPAALPMAWAIRALATLPIGVSRFIIGTFERVPGGPRMQLLHARFRRLPEQPERPGRTPFVVGYVGQIEPRKRVPDLLEALTRTPDVQALIVGDGKQRGRVERDTRRLGLGGRVELAGFRNDVASCYAAMDCVVMPARDEPCPLVAVEAMSAGRPVIAAKHGGHPELLGDAALYFPLGDAAALAACVERLRREPETRRQLRQRGLERARAFDPETWLDEAERCLRAAAGLDED